MSSNDSDGRVNMVHPDLPDTVIRPKASKADAYRAGGWVLETEAKAEAEQQEAADAAQSAEPAKTEGDGTEPAASSDPKKRRTTATEKKEA